MNTHDSLSFAVTVPQRLHLINWLPLGKSERGIFGP